MKTDIVKKRIGQVLRIDSIDSTESDFLATHVPFHNIAVLSHRGGNFEEARKTEDEIYREIFETENSLDEHQLIIVEGSSGAGKSHFIRWIQARLKVNYEQNDVILLIRRSDNTLKGTIRQLLEIDEVKQIANKDAYERLVRANQTITEDKFKSTIYHQFIIELENDTSETLSRIKLKKLVALFNNSVFQDKMMEPGGPVDRICNKIKNSGTNADADLIAQFKPEDLTLDIDFIERLDDADKKARDFANSLLEGDNEEYIKMITDYLNSFVESVIQTSAGIEPGDFQQIFKEIRQELHRQGKNLILLVEDITSFTGINQELLNALVTGHTGKNAVDKMCRLISVIGTTSEYYRQFRDNYRDRITKQITIHEGALGEQQADVIQFAAKYLNALSLEESELNEWAKNGAHAEELPVSDDTDHKHWDHYAYSDTKKICLYPFTKAAIVNLYEAMPDQKTPRYILRDIIEPAVREAITDIKAFPSFCIGSEWHSSISESVENRIGSLTSSFDIPGEEKTFYRKRLIAFIKFWTNKTLDLTSDGYISGVKKELFSDLIFDDFVDKLKETSVITKAVNKIEGPVTEIPMSKQDRSPVAKPVPVISHSVQNDVKKAPDVDPKKQEQYEKFKRNVISWHRDGKALISSLQVREEISKFIYNSINWQQEGVPLDSEKRFEASVGSRIIGFRRQDQAEDKSIVILEDTEETYQLLLCFGKWVYLGNKTWSFPDAASSIYFATSWLIRNKNRFIKAVNNTAEGDQIPVYVRAALIEQIFKRIINGTIGIKDPKKIRESFLLMQDDKKNDSAAFKHGHSKSWYDLQSFIFNHSKCSDSHDASVRYFNLIQGVQLRSENYVLNYSSFMSAFKQIRLSEYIINSDETGDIKKEVKEKKEIIELTLKTLEKIRKVVEDESALALRTAEEIIGYFDGLDTEDEIEESDIRSLLNDIRSFYQKCFSTGVNIPGINEINENIKKLLANAGTIAAAINVMKEDYSSEDDLSVLMVFSSNPTGCVLSFLDLLKQTDSDTDRVYRAMTAEKNNLVKQGSWKDDTDPRFEEEAEAFCNLYASFSEVK